MTDSVTENLAELLARGLDLCVRAQKLDDPIELLPVDHPENECDWPIQRQRCATPHLWILNRYDEDLAAWKAESEEFLTKNGLSQ